MRRPLALLAWLLLVPVALYACADDDNTPPGPKMLPLPEASTPADTSVADTGAKVVAMCMQSDFDAPAGASGGDYTGMAGVTITFPTGSAPAQYTNRCVKVKVGAKVTFMGSFPDHPLEPNGGDMPTPIPTLTNMNPDGGSLELTMSTKGTYGYECNFHPSIMFGAIQVVP
jgi:plastocyanin